MAESNMVLCPACLGEKTIPGICECSTEWRGTQKGDDWEDCQCTPEQECKTCKGTGKVKSDN